MRQSSTVYTEYWCCNVCTIRTWYRHYHCQMQRLPERNAICDKSEQYKKSFFPSSRMRQRNQFFPFPEKSVYCEHYFTFSFVPCKRALAQCSPGGYICFKKWSIPPVFYTKPFTVLYITQCIWVDGLYTHAFGQHPRRFSKWISVFRSSDGDSRVTRHLGYMLTPPEHIKLYRTPVEDNISGEQCPVFCLPQRTRF